MAEIIAGIFAEEYSSSPKITKNITQISHYGSFVKETAFLFLIVHISPL